MGRWVAGSAAAHIGVVLDNVITRGCLGVVGASMLDGGDRRDGE